MTDLATINQLFPPRPQAQLTDPEADRFDFPVHQLQQLMPSVVPHQPVVARGLTAGC